MRTQDYGFARTEALLFFFLASILGLGILTAPSTWPVRNGTVSGTAFVKPARTPIHGRYTMAVVYAAAYQDAGQAAPLAAIPPPPATHAQPKIVELPAGEGKPLATEYCQDCHLLTNLTRAHKSSDDWLETVQTMMDRGARLPPEDVDTLVKYLARNFPPKTDVPAPDAQTGPAPAAVPGPAAAAAVATPNAPVQVKKVELPEGDGKAIAIQNCQDCHRLTNLAKARKSLDDWRDTVQLMIDRGANLPADQVETLVQYLAKNFGPAPAGSGADAPSAGAAANGSSQSQGPSAAPAVH